MKSMTKVFQTTKTITFRDCDPAGIMFFGNIFAFAHDAFEEFIQKAGYTYKDWFATTEYMIPIRHTEADFRAPFRAGHTYDITVSVASFGETSFKMKYVFSDKAHVHATVYMVHAVLDQKTKQKLALPAVLQTRLRPYLETSAG